MHRLYGTEPSFYTRKAWASLRLLGLPVDDRLKSLAVKAEVEAAVDGYHRFPVVQCPDGDWIVDSTRIALALCERYPEQSLLPDDPALAALLLIAEDWLDEWFLRATIAWRGVDAGTRAWVAERGARNLFGYRASDALPEPLAAKLPKAVAGIEAFFLGACATNAVVPETAAAVRALVDGSLAAFDAMLAESPYLAGSRPSVADAALWGFLAAGLLWEPAPAAHCRARYPAVVAFHARLSALADAGGRPLGAWDPMPGVAARLAPLLSGDAFGFAPFLDRNRVALADGSRRTWIDGVEVPARGFTEKSRQALGARVAALDPADRARLDAAAGDWPLLAAYRA
jgi:glutathione S-transferase